MDEILEYGEKYWECKRLIEVESKKDPETEPYRSKYKALGILLEMKDSIRKKIEGSEKTAAGLGLEKRLASVIFLIGLVYLETEELTKAKEYFSECLASIQDHLDPLHVSVSLLTRNCMGIIASKTGDCSVVRDWFEGAEKLYKDFKSCPGRVVEPPFSSPGDVGAVQAQKDFETGHTMTKFYLAQFYGVMKNFLKSAVYCHETLKRELSQEYDPIYWALNSATLSQFFLERILFKQARHHLAAASYVLDTYTEGLNGGNESQEELEANKEKLQHRSADVSRCWAKYGIFLLEHSKNRMSSAEGEEKKEEREEEEEEGDECLEGLWFDSLDLSLYENQIADAEVVAFEDARDVFLITQKHLNKAKEYYTLEDRASDHVQIVQDHSQLFRHLTAFEKDEERQFKMMKRRVCMLESVLKELNPKYYMDICRQLWFEMGETYHDMMQMKFQKVKESNEVPAPQDLKKINSLAESSMSNFNEFLDSIKDKKTKELPDPLPEELTGPTLVAHFYLGRLYYKYITPDKRKEIENTTKAHECFKFLVDYCEKYETAKSLLGEELNISKQMITLLQMKVLQL